MQRFMAVTRLVAKTTSFWFLVSLLPVSGYGQKLVQEGYELRDAVARSAGLHPRTVPDYPVVPPSHRPISSVLWPVPSMVPNTPVLPPATAPHATYRSRSGTKRLIAGLVGTGLTGLGAYLVATEEGPNPIWEFCTLCSEPPTSHARVHATGTQVAGVVSILGGVAFLFYAIGP